MIDVEQKFLKMLKFQDLTNTYICNGIDGAWKDRRYNWRRAIWIECAELMEHYGNWKWWKKSQKPNVDDCFLECVDIWHFALSWMIEKEKSVEGVMESKHYRDLCAFMNVDKFHPNEENKHAMIHSAIEGIALQSLQFQFDVRNFLHLIDLLDKDFNDLYKWYFGKNTLNVFRNDHGYLDGNYEKKWYVDSINAYEDNEHLAKILNEIEDLDAVPQTYVYEKLKELYNVSLVVRGLK